MTSHDITKLMCSVFVHMHALTCNSKKEFFHFDGAVPTEVQPTRVAPVLCEVSSNQEVNTKLDGRGPQGGRGDGRGPPGGGGMGEAMGEAHQMGRGMGGAH